METWEVPLEVTDLYCDFLDDFPTEILLHICSFLDAKTIWRTLSRVSLTLHDLLSSDRFWKIRISKRWPQKFPAIPVNQREFDWKSACEIREEQNRLWSSNAEAMENVIYAEGIFAPVDSVHLMKDNEILAAGSRDRYINIIKLSDLKADDPSSEKNCSLLSTDKIHKGWIWCMKSIDNTLVTGSWDASVAMTDMDAGGSVLRRVKCKSAVLCLHCEPDVVFMGIYGKRVIQFDPRTAETISTKSYHLGPVLSMVGTENYIITGSEDSTIVIFDRRADAVMHTYKFPVSYPVSMAIDRDELWVGDHEGNLHLFDASDGEIAVVQDYPELHGKSITGVIHSLGSLITSSTDGSIQVRQPSLQANLITTLTPDVNEITRMDFQDNVLAAGCAKGLVSIWRPKQRPH